MSTKAKVSTTLCWREIITDRIDNYVDEKFSQWLYLRQLAEYGWRYGLNRSVRNIGGTDNR